MKLNPILQTPSIDWAHYEERAQTLTYEELEAARKDAFETARTNPETEGLYMDEMSVYALEMARREGR